MANLQIKGIDDAFYQKIKDMAAAENRSVSQQVLFLLKSHMARGKMIQKIKPPARVLLDLNGSWQDAADAEVIVDEIRQGRRNSRKLREGF